MEASQQDELPLPLKQEIYGTVKEETIPCKKLTTTVACKQSTIKKTDINVQTNLSNNKSVIDSEQNISDDNLEELSDVARPKSVTATIFASAIATTAVITPEAIQSDGNNHQQHQPLLQLAGPNKPQSITASIFAPLPMISSRASQSTKKVFIPRTEDMNKGFLTFTDENSPLTSEC